MRLFAVRIRRSPLRSAIRKRRLFTIILLIVCGSFRNWSCSDAISRDLGGSSQSLLLESFDRLFDRRF
ncbi:unnamed protein product [Musa textilis]